MHAHTYTVSPFPMKGFSVAKTSFCTQARSISPKLGKQHIDLFVQQTCSQVDSVVKCPAKMKTRTPIDVEVDSN
eukprot:3045502-Amphidinium_carterae.1